MTINLPTTGWITWDSSGPGNPRYVKLQTGDPIPDQPGKVALKLYTPYEGYGIMLAIDKDEFLSLSREELEQLVEKTWYGTWELE